VRRAALAALLVVSCSAGGVSAQPRDVALKPAEALGLSSCSSSGTMAQTLVRLKNSDAASYDSTNQEWSNLKQAGATGGYFAVFSDDTQACATFSPGSSPSPSREIGNVVVQFKDSVSAGKAYTGGAFGVDPGQATAAGGVSGAETGLGKNSVRAFVTLGSAQIYLAYWQHDRWLAYVFGVGLTQAEGDRVTRAVDARL
jgi:hypothetical protein